jgi:benzoyl-CoA-dihydrodiol lyase
MAGALPPCPSVEFDRQARLATTPSPAPTAARPGSPRRPRRQGSDFWPLAVARELDDAILHLRFNEPELGT